MSTDSSNPFGLRPYEKALWEQAGRPLGQDFHRWSALINGIKGAAVESAQKADARIAAAGQVEVDASRERYWQWQADRLDEDARVTELLLETEAAVVAEQEAEREAWKARQARLDQLGKLL